MAENKYNSPEVSIDELDRKILSFVMKDARTPFMEIARECGVSGAAVHQRVQRLVNMGVVIGSEFLVDPSKIGYQTCAYIGIFLKEASYYDDVVVALKNIPQVVECHYTTGRYAIFIKLYAKSNAHMKHILADHLQKIPGISATETIISLEESFKRQISAEE